MKTLFSLLVAGLCAVWLAGCAAAPAAPLPSATAPAALTLTPYRAQPLPSRTPLPSAAPGAQPVPSPSPTPRTHTVARGEDLFGIALRYGLTVEALRAANPEVNPDFLSVGAVLVIPGGAPDAAAATAGVPSPTPLPLQLSGPFCWASPDGGLTCLALAANPGTAALENVAARIRVQNGAGEILDEEAYGLLDLLPAGQSLPLVVFFPGFGGQAAATAAEPLRAFAHAAGDPRYTAVELQNRQVTIAADGASALVEVELSAPAGARSARLAAWALDAQGRPVAARRWDAPGALAAGEPQSVTLTLYSLGGPIVSVSTLAEASP